jgi:hypothetical protein
MTWEIDDEVFIRINDVYLDLISFISGTTEGSKTGAFSELAVSTDQPVWCSSLTL